MENPFKMNELTEEQVSQVVNYFDTWDIWNLTESKIWYMYGRMKHQGIKFDKAEEYLSKQLKRKQESYRWQKEQELNEHSKQYRQEKAWDTWKFELMRLKEWEDWRTMVIWFMEKFDEQTGKYKRSHAVEIEERLNPSYFQEIADRFNLVID